MSASGTITGAPVSKNNWQTVGKQWREKPRFGPLCFKVSLTMEALSQPQNCARCCSILQEALSKAHSIIFLCRIKKSKYQKFFPI